MEQAREEGQPVDEIAQAAADGAEITTEIIKAEDGGHEIIIAAEDEPDDELLPETMEIHYDVPGSARKALASATAHTPAIRPLPASPTSSANTPWIGTAY